MVLVQNRGKENRQMDKDIYFTWFQLSIQHNRPHETGWKTGVPVINVSLTIIIIIIMSPLLFFFNANDCTSIHGEKSVIVLATWKSAYSEPGLNILVKKRPQIALFHPTALRHRRICSHTTRLQSSFAPQDLSLLNSSTPLNNDIICIEPLISYCYSSIKVLQSAFVIQLCVVI